MLLFAPPDISGHPSPKPVRCSVSNCRMMWERDDVSHSESLLWPSNPNPWSHSCYWKPPFAVSGCFLFSQFPGTHGIKLHFPPQNETLLRSGKALYIYTAICSVCCFQLVAFTALLRNGRFF